MDQSMKNLFTPFNIGNVTIKNRFCLGPTGVPNLLGHHGQFSKEGIEYYLERARGGFGLVYTGAFIPDMQVDPYDPATGTSMLQYPMDFRSAALPLNEQLASYGTKAFIQIGAGVGRNYPTFPSCSETEVFGYPSFKSPEMTVDQIKKKIESVVGAAGLAQASGFAGVEVHALHWGYLLDQFALAITNHRTDEYGGSLENRLRIVKEIIDGIKQVCGANFPVTMRLGLKSYIKGLNQASLTGEDEAGRTLEEGIRICQLLESYGFDALSVDTGIYDSFYYACPPCYMPHGHALDLYAEAKKAVNIPILAGSRMGDPELCAKALEEGKADAFVLVRPALADPYFPKKVEMGQIDKIRTCIGCNQGCVGRYLEKGLAPTCAVNPRAYRELTTKPKQSTNPKSILIVGGGVAGMEAARTATMNGHKVELYEKSGILGGELLPAGAHSFKHEVLKLNDWYKRELEDLNIPVYLNTEATPEMIKAKKPDVVILAVGASPIMPASIPGINHEKAVSGVDALTGKKAIGQKVVIVGGGVVGCEIAMDYAMEGKDVTIIEALDDILKTGDLVPQQNNGMIRDMLKHYKIDVRTSHKLDSINDTGAVIVPTAGGDAQTLEADTVVLSIGLRSNASMASELYGEGMAVYEIGSGRTPSNILSAVSDAFEVAYNLD